MESPLTFLSLVDLCVPAADLPAHKALATTLPSLQLDSRTVDNLELLATGAFTPLDRFMGAADCARVQAEMRLADGTFFPTPVVLPLPPSAMVRVGEHVALRDPRNELLGTLRVDELFDAPAFGQACVGGPVHLLQPPSRPDFRELRRPPVAGRAALGADAGSDVAAIQVWQPSAAFARWRADPANSGRAVLLQVLAPSGPAGRLDHVEAVRWARALVADANDARALVTVLPLARPPDPVRALLLQALVARSYGVTRLLLDPAEMANQMPPSELDAATNLARRELGVELEVLAGAMEPRAQAPSRTAGPALQGVCVWFTGLSGAGKSTTAEIVSVLAQEQGRTVTLLDGDVVRTHLSSGLGFSRADRDTNIHRIGFVAGEIVRHGGMVICAAVSPYRAVRDEVRQMVGGDYFVEVFVNTPIDECERRDVKGMYARARRGEITGFTGVDDPYEPPLAAEIELDTTVATPEENARRVVAYLVERGFLDVPSWPTRP